MISEWILFGRVLWRDQGRFTLHWQTSNFPSAYFVLGFGGNGITFSVIGMELVSEMLKKKTSFIRIFKFRGNFLIY
jgi:glycine/D-amino acid oxidase-like deaminating enzyme